jgi:serine/threonine-protein kinase
VGDRGADILPTTSLGHYQVRAKIGSGGMGDVFDAIHTGLDKRVAIKTLRKRFLDDDIVVQRFLREGQLASRIRHPNIVDVTDVGMMGGLPCLVMEHLEGESLSALLRREGKLSTEQMVDLLLPIIAAVHFAHEHGVVHRDLKPSNIFLARAWNGEITSKVLDFGISKLVHDSQQATLTTDSAFVGTPHYASPELMRADKSADGRSDQYSMGVILYECVTGVRPFVDLGNNFIALAMAICNGDYPPVHARNPHVPPGIEHVIRRAMSLAVADRFPTMRALGESLLSFANQRTRWIWSPTFTSGQKTGEVAAPPALGSGATLPQPFLGVTPNGVPAAHPSQSPSHPTPISHHVLSPTGPHWVPSSFPPGTPPAQVMDRMPSYGAGTSVPQLPRPRAASGAMTAVIALIVGVAVLVMAIVLRGPRRSDELHAATAPPKPIATYGIDLQVSPPTAVVRIDNVVVPAGRIMKSYPRDGQHHTLQASAPDHESLTLEFDENAPPPAAIALRSLPKPVVTPQGGTHRSPSPAPTGGAVKTKGNSDKAPKTDNINPWE